MMIKGSIISGEIVGKIVIVNQLNREHILEPCLRVTFCENFHSQIENVRFDSKCKTDRFEKAEQVEVVGFPFGETLAMSYWISQRSYQSSLLFEPPFRISCQMQQLEKQRLELNFTVKKKKRSID